MAWMNGKWIVDISNVLQYSMRPDESLFEAIIQAGMIANNNGFNGYIILDQNGKEIPGCPKS